MTNELTPERRAHVDAVEGVWRALLALEDAWDETTDADGTNERAGYPFESSLDEVRASVARYAERLQQ